jgi:hypothetical protein
MECSRQLLNFVALRADSLYPGTGRSDAVSTTFYVVISQKPRTTTVLWKGTYMAHLDGFVLRS